VHGVFHPKHMSMIGARRVSCTINCGMHTLNVSSYDVRLVMQSCYVRLTVHTYDIRLAVHTYDVHLTVQTSDIKLIIHTH
jgi:hypothetical protein